MSGKGKPKLKKIAQRWVNGELSASQLQEELQNKYGNAQAVWEQLANEVETIRNKPQRSWRPLILNLLKIGVVILVVAALVFLGWQWWQLNDRLARLEATPAATQVAETPPVSPQPEASPTHTPVPAPTEPPQPQIDTITFGDVPERLYVNGDPVTLTFTVTGQSLEGQTIEFSLAPEEASTRIVKVDPIGNGAGSLSLQPGKEVERVSLTVGDSFGVTGLPAIDIYPSPNITASINPSTESIDETNPVTYTLTLSNNGEKTIFNVETQCQLPSQLKLADGSISAQDTERLVDIGWKPIESIGTGGSQKIDFAAVLNDDGSDSTGQVVCQVTAEGLQEPMTVQSAALTIARQQLEIRNVTIDPPYMATRIESTITAEIWQGGQPLTEGVTVTVTAGGNQLKASEVITPEGGKIAIKVIPEDGNVGQSVTVTVSYENTSNTTPVAGTIYPSIIVNKQHNLRMGDSDDSAIVGEARGGDVYPAVSKSPINSDFVQVCCVGGHLVWDGSGQNYKTLQPSTSLQDSRKFEVIGSRNLVAEDKQTIILSGFLDEKDKRAVVEIVDEISKKVRLRGWIAKSDIDIDDSSNIGVIRSTGNNTPPVLMLSLVQPSVTVQVMGGAIGFVVEVVSTQPVGPNSDLIPIIVEGYLGE